MCTFLASWTTPRDNVNTVAMTDVYYHVDEADHMVRMLLPERQFTRAMVARAYETGS